MENTDKIEMVEKMERELMELFNVLQEYKNTIQNNDKLGIISRGLNAGHAHKIEKDIAYMLLKYSLVAGFENEKFMEIAKEKFDMPEGFDEINPKSLLNSLALGINNVINQDH